MSAGNPLEIINLKDRSRTNANKIVEAAASQGFLMFEGHDFSQEEVELLFKISKDFFKLPVEEKVKFNITLDNAGYTGMGVENLEEDQLGKPIGDPKEGFNFASFDLTTATPNQPIPPYFEDKMEMVKSTVLKLRKALSTALELLAEGLEIKAQDGSIDNQWFANRHADTDASGTTFRFLHYPCPVAPGATEEEKSKFSNLNVAGAHTDYGTVTLLFQQEGESGLQIHSPVSKKWEEVPYVAARGEFAEKGEAAPLVVNIADQLCYWTNGVLKSTIHRVRFPKDLLDQGKDRYSIVLFAHPGHDTVLEPVPSKRIESVKGRGASYYMEKHGVSQTAGEHLNKRLSSTYGWKY